MMTSMARALKSLTRMPGVITSRMSVVMSRDDPPRAGVRGRRALQRGGRSWRRGRGLGAPRKPDGLGRRFDLRPHGMSRIDEQSPEESQGAERPTEISHHRVMVVPERFVVPLQHALGQE